jgi:hypothetical protein
MMVFVIATACCPSKAVPQAGTSSEKPQPTSASPTQPVPDGITPEAMYKLAWDFFDGSNGHPKDAVQAVYWYQKAAEQGYADAQYNLGVMYATGGGGLIKDESKAVYWWQKAAAQGQVNSQYNLGLWYELGRGGLSKSLAKAQYWYEKSAGAGDPVRADASARLFQLEESQKCGAASMERHAVIAGRLREGQTQQQVKAILNSEGFDVFSDVNLRGRVAPGPWICKPLVGRGIAPGERMVECLAYRNGLQEFGLDFRVSQTYRNPDTGELYQVKVDRLTQIYDQLKKACSPEH